MPSTIATTWLLSDSPFACRACSSITILRRTCSSVSSFASSSFRSNLSCICLFSFSWFAIIVFIRSKSE